MNDSELEIRFEAIIKNLSLAIIIEDENRNVILVNDVFMKMFAISLKPEQLIGFDCSNVIEQIKHLFKEPDIFVEQILVILAKRIKVINQVLYLVDGRVLLQDYIPVFKGDIYLGYMWSYLDISEQFTQKAKLEEQNQMLLEMVDKDYLTGCYSRRYLFKYWADLNQDLIQVCSILMLDVDNFKLINDQHGHCFGDYALVQIVKAVNISLTNEVFVRYGGEEFCVFQLNSSNEKLLELASKILNEVRKSGFTISIGAVVVNNLNKLPLNNQIDYILKLSDENLYKAKQNGKNQLIWSNL